MQRPTIVCHMITSLDGRLLPQRWPVDAERLMALYEGAAARLGADGWIVGRRTMADYLPTGDAARAAAHGPRADRIADAHAGSLAICVDRAGRLRPETGEVDGDHLVLVVSERVSETHVADLAARGVSVVFAGPDGNDIAGALIRLRAAFGASRLLLEGGGRINGAFLAADLIDETSTLVFPVIDGQREIPAIYDTPNAATARPLALISAETLDDGTVWLRHRVRRR